MAGSRCGSKNPSRELTPALQCPSGTDRDPLQTFGSNHQPDLSVDPDRGGPS
jgi:hypothetical protein